MHLVPSHDYIFCTDWRNYSFGYCGRYVSNRLSGIRLSTSKYFIHSCTFRTVSRKSYGQYHTKPRNAFTIQNLAFLRELFLLKTILQYCSLNGVLLTLFGRLFLWRLTIGNALLVTSDCFKGEPCACRKWVGRWSPIKKIAKSDTRIRSNVIYCTCNTTYTTKNFI